jgi:putative ABC transport system substrate-binding protein
MVIRFVALAVAFATLAAPVAARAQTATKMPKVGWLSDGVRAEPRSVLHDAFLQGLRDHGYVEGNTVLIERRDAAQKMERLDELARELVASKVTVIVATSGAAALAAKRATTSIPIVMAEAGDPVAIGLVASLARPGGNVTGLTVMDQEIAAKRVQLLKEVAPGITHLAVLYHPPFPATRVTVDQVRSAAGRLGVAVLPMEVVGPERLESAFNTAVKQRADAVLTSGDPFSTRHQRRIIDLAAKHRLPAVSVFRDFAEAGGLMAYGPSLPGMYRQAAVFVDKIVKGVSPADLPIEQPAKFELVINLKTARALGLTIPSSVLVRADQVIE